MLAGTWLTRRAPEGTGHGGPAAATSIAVLPFEHLGDDASGRYFADGISDDLITDLTRIPGLTVISRDSTFSYRSQRPDIRQVGIDLGVRFVLHGSVGRSGGRLRILDRFPDGLRRAGMTG
jgi:TolB-like protein